MQTAMIPMRVCACIENIVQNFMWGSFENGIKPALVKWDTCYQPILKGDLGLHKLEFQNKAFLIKMAFQLVTKVDELWVRILRTKYKVTEICSNGIGRSVCSYVWDSLAKIWNQFKENVIWSIGDGSKVSFAHDQWVPRLGFLKDYLLPGTSIPDQVKVADFLDVNGGWNWDKLKVFFPKDVLERLAACHPPHVLLGGDVCMWKLNSNGLFSVRTTYRSIAHAESLLMDNRWKLVWDNGLPPRVKFFLWLVRRGRLMTNHDRVRRRMATDAA